MYIRLCIFDCSFTTLIAWALPVKFLPDECHWTLTYEKVVFAHWQVIVCCRKTTSHYLTQYWPRLMSPYSVTTPQCPDTTKRFYTPVSFNYHRLHEDIIIYAHFSYAYFANNKHFLAGYTDRRFVTYGLVAWFICHGIIQKSENVSGLQCRKFRDLVVRIKWAGFLAFRPLAPKLEIAIAMSSYSCT